MSNQRSWKSYEDVARHLLNDDKSLILNVRMANEVAGHSASLRKLRRQAYVRISCNRLVSVGLSVEATQPGGEVGFAMPKDTGDRWHIVSTFATTGGSKKVAEANNDYPCD